MDSMKNIIDNLGSPTINNVIKQCPKHKTFLTQVKWDGRVITEYCQTCQREKDLKQMREMRLRQAEEARKQEAMRRHTIIEGLKQRVGREYDFSLQDFQATKEQLEMFDLAIDFKQEQRGFYFHGRQGLGKTLLAKIITRNVALQGKTYQFKTLSELNYQLEAKLINERLAFLEEHKQADLLVIDDLGRHSTTSKLLKDFFFTLINFRLESNINTNKTIITSNLTFADVNRLNFFEMDRWKRFRQLEFRGKSRRGVFYAR